MSEEPKRLPHAFHRWNRAHRGSFLKGWRAFRAGAERADNPYRDKRDPRTGRILLGVRGFWNAWDDGWLNARAEADSQKEEEKHGISVDGNGGMG